MKVEISKEQKTALAERIALCVNFLKSEVQPHIIKSDVIAIGMGDDLDLYVSSDKIYVKETKVYTLGVEFCLSRKFLLEKHHKKKTKGFICEAAPELAVEFLKHWESAKAALEKQVAEKKKKVSELDKFVGDFQV